MKRTWAVDGMKQGAMNVIRGKVYTIKNIKFLVLGGALSIDKKFRKPDKNWWKQECWNETKKRSFPYVKER